jgi:hypothetical protein
MHRHTWILDMLIYHLDRGDVVVGHWKCECGLTKESREYL